MYNYINICNKKYWHLSKIKRKINLFTEKTKDDSIDILRLYAKWIKK